MPRHEKTFLLHKTCCLVPFWPARNQAIALDFRINLFILLCMQISFYQRSILNCYVWYRKWTWKTLIVLFLFVIEPLPSSYWKHNTVCFENPVIKASLHWGIHKHLTTSIKCIMLLKIFTSDNLEIKCLFILYLMTDTGNQRAIKQVWWIKISVSLCC